MKTIYAIRMVEPDDILQFAGRPFICEYLFSDIKNNKNDNVLTRMKDDEILDISTSPSGNLPVYNMTRSLYLRFVPVDLIEEKIMVEKIITELEAIKPNLMTINRIERIDKFIESLDKKYSRLRDKCAGDKIIKSSCFMFMYEDDKIHNVYVAVPRIIINNILSLSEQEYNCTECKKVFVAKNNSLDEFMPDIYYEVSSDNEIIYYCNECNKNHKGLKHIGQ